MMLAETVVSQVVAVEVDEVVGDVRLERNVQMLTLGDGCCGYCRK